MWLTAASWTILIIPVNSFRNFVLAYLISFVNQVVSEPLYYVYHFSLECTVQKVHLFSIKLGNFMIYWKFVLPMLSPLFHVIYPIGENMLFSFLATQSLNSSPLSFPTNPSAFISIIFCTDVFCSCSSNARRDCFSYSCG